MTATVAGSSAITKILYPGGKLPDANFKQNVLGAMMNKATDFKGESVLSLCKQSGRKASPLTSRPRLPRWLSRRSANSPSRASSTSVSPALRARRSELSKATPGRLSICGRTKSTRSARTSLASLVSLDTSRVLAHSPRLTPASTVASATITVSPTSAIVFYAVGMRVQATSSDGGALRGGGAAVTISAIDIDAGTLTTAGGNWSTQIAGLTASTDYLNRAGDAQNAGTALVPVGAEGWVVGGSSPGTLFGLSRNSNPVKLSGQSYNATGTPYTDVVVEMAARVAAVGGEAGDKLFCHPRDIANWKKQLDGKVQYNRSEVASKVTGLSFKALQVEGANGTIDVLADINCRETRRSS